MIAQFQFVNFGFFLKGLFFVIIDLSWFDSWWKSLIIFSFLLGFLNFPLIIFYYLANFLLVLKHYIWNVFIVGYFYRNRLYFQCPHSCQLSNWKNCLQFLNSFIRNFKFSWHIFYFNRNLSLKTSHAIANERLNPSLNTLLKLIWQSRRLRLLLFIHFKK